MLGEGIVSLGTAVVTDDLRNVKASAKIVSSSRTRSLTRSAAEVKEVAPSLLRNATSICWSVLVMPPIW